MGEKSNESEDSSVESPETAEDSFIWGLSDDDEQPLEKPAERPRETTEPRFDPDEYVTDKQATQGTKEGDNADPSIDSKPHTSQEKSGRLWHKYEDEIEQSSRETDEPPPDTSAADSEHEPREKGGRLWDTVRSKSGEGTQNDTTKAEGATGTQRQSEADQTDSDGKTSSFDRFIENRSGTIRSKANSQPVMGTGASGLFDELGEFDRITSGSQILVISPLGHEVTEEVFTDFITAGEATTRNILLISTEDESNNLLTPNFFEVSVQGGGEMSMIEVGDVSSDDTGDFLNEIEQTYVSNPKNLSKVGLLVMQTLRDWESNSHSTVVCFHTLSSLRGFVKNQTLFQFLFTLQRKLTSSGVSGLFHIDDRRYQEEELNTLKELFDIVLKVAPNREIRVE